MFQNILVPVDLSERNQVSVRAAAELADPATASVTLLHVIETIQDVPFDEIEDFYQTLRERAEESIGRWAAELTEKGLRIRREIVFGKRGWEILRYAEEQRCDLIVLTSHRVDQERPTANFGTISHQVALLAPCPVLLMR